MSENPYPCCGVLVDCCENTIPEVLIATLENVANCAALDGMEITLFYDGFLYWKGTAQCASRSLYLHLYCTAAGGCQFFQMNYNLGCEVTGGPMTESCTCEPVNLVFLATGATSFGCDCCDENASVEIQVTITEP